MGALDAITLQQLLALLKRAQLQTRQAKSTYKGVQPRGTGFWRARFRSSEVQHSATFSTEDEAARAYDRWAMQHVGRHAVTNFIYSGEEFDAICGPGGEADEGGPAARVAGVGTTLGRQSRLHAGQGGRRNRKVASDSEGEASADDSSSDGEDMDLDTATPAAGTGIAGRLRQRNRLRHTMREADSGSEGSEAHGASERDTDEEENGFAFPAEPEGSFDFPTEPESSDDDDAMPPCKRRQPSGVVPFDQLTEGCLQELADMECFPGWHEYFQPAELPPPPNVPLPDEQTKAPNPYDMGRVNFLKYAWNYQHSLQAEGDAGVERSISRIKEAAARGTAMRAAAAATAATAPANGAQAPVAAAVAAATDTSHTAPGVTVQLPASYVPLCTPELLPAASGPSMTTASAVPLQIATAASAGPQAPLPANVTDSAAATPAPVPAAKVANDSAPEAAAEVPAGMTPATFAAAQRAGLTTEIYLEMLGRLGFTAQEYEAAVCHEWTMPDHMLAEHDPEERASIKERTQTFIDTQLQFPVLKPSDTPSYNRDPYADDPPPNRDATTPEWHVWYDQYSAKQTAEVEKLLAWCQRCQQT